MSVEWLWNKMYSPLRFLSYSGAKTTYRGLKPNLGHQVVISGMHLTAPLRLEREKTPRGLPWCIDGSEIPRFWREQICARVQNTETELGKPHTFAKLSNC